MRILILAVTCLIAIGAGAQITLNKPVVLVGGNAVTGLQAPQVKDQALTAASLQAAGYAYCQASGVNTLSGILLPMIDSLTTGMSVYIECAQTNTGAVSLQLNSLPPVSVIKGGIYELDSADLVQGMVMHLVYDGSQFQLINASERSRRTCPNGATQINDQYCIEQNSRPALDFPEAAEVCGDLGGKICSWAEFYYACERDSLFMLNDMVGDYEWTNTLANADDNVRVAGIITCRSAGTTTTISTTPRTFRCCYRR